jgi:hypothetical protein
MNEYRPVLNQLAALLTSPMASTDDLLDPVQQIAAAAVKMRDEFRDQILDTLADLLERTDSLRAAMVAMCCGALVESGGDPQLAIGPILDHATNLLLDAQQFRDACYRRAIQEPLAETVHGSGSGFDPPSPVDRFGPEIGQRMPREGMAWMMLQRLCLGAVAHLSRSPDARRVARSRPDLLEAVEPLEADHADVEWLGRILRVVDDEPLVVIHPERRRGYRVVISGLADNFQLHTLLADRLIGAEEDGLLPGTRPDRAAVLAASHGPVDGKIILAHGHFNLWAWTGLQTDGRLPEGINGHEHWLWNEDFPGDIPQLDETRIILLGPPPYDRVWRAGRVFVNMAGSVELQERLTTEATEAWLQRIMQAGQST